MSPFEVFLLIIAAILLVVAGVFAALSANQISKIDGYSTTPSLVAAQSWMIWSTVAAWVGVVFLILLLIIFFLVKSADDRAGVDFSSSGWVRFLIFIVFAFLLTSAIFASIGLAGLSKATSGSTDVNAKSSFTNGLIATIVAYIGAVLALIAFFISFGNSGTATAQQQQQQQQKGGTTFIQQPSSSAEAAEGGEAAEGAEIAEAAEFAPLLV